MNVSSRRNLQLDVLRGVAILLVLGRHLQLERPEGAIGSLAEGWFRLGWLGVDLFFVLSGFLIGGLLLGEVRRHGSIDIGRFLIRRGFKIYPAYFVFIGYLIAMPVAKSVAGGGGAWSAFQRQWDQYWPNLLFLQNYVGANPAGHTWSLAVEEHFYLMLPFMLAALAAAGRMRQLVAVCVTAGVICLGLRYLSVWSNDAFSVRMAATHLRIDALLCGVGLRAAVEYFPDAFRRLGSYRGGVLAVGIACWSVNLFIEPSTGFIRTIGLTLTYLGGAAFLIAAFHTSGKDFGAVRRPVSIVASVVAWIGVYSYGIYLWHTTAMGILEREIGLRVTAMLGMNSVSWLIAATAACLGAVFVGVLLSKLVEFPALRVRDRLFPSRLTALPGAPGDSPALHQAGVAPAASVAPRFARDGWGK